MSHIATALAKAKERPGAQAAFVLGGSVPKPTAAIERRVPVNVIWAIVLGISALSAGGLVWWNLQAEKSTDEGLAIGAPASTTYSTHAFTPSGQAATPSAAGASAQTAAPVTLSASALAAKFAKNDTAVRQLNISAVMPGEQPRIMANGRVYQVGDMIIPPEISFAGTNDGQLVFTDTTGNRFTRRY